MVMALVAAVYLRKKGKVNRPSGLKGDAVGVLYRAWPGKSKAMHLFRDKWLQRGEQMNGILE